MDCGCELVFSTTIIWVVHWNIRITRKSLDLLFIIIYNYYLLFINLIIYHWIIIYSHCIHLASVDHLITVLIENFSVDIPFSLNCFWTDAESWVKFAHHWQLEYRYALLLPSFEFCSAKSRWRVGPSIYCEIR